MPYVKLDTGILNSTLWMDRDCREIFITALLMAEPREYPIPIAQWRISELVTSGWEAPAGWYGFVPAAGIGIIRRAGIPDSQGFAALERLGQPEGDSRNPEFDGRRMIRVTDGYLILNYMRFRDKDHTARDRQRRLRARKKLSTVMDSNGVTGTSNGVTRETNGYVTRNITQSDADADADAYKTLSQSSAKAVSEKELAPIDVFRQLTKTDGKEPPRTKRIQAAVDAVGGWTRIKTRTPSEVPMMEREFCVAYREFRG